MNKWFRIIGFGVFAGLIMAQTAHAQFVANSSAPININADDLEYAGNKTILTGGVDVRQGQDRMLADKMIIISPQGGSLTDNDFERIIAEGNFYFITPEQSVRGQNAVYTRTNNSFIVTGDVILKQKDGNIITGDKLYYNLTTKHARVVGTCKGRKCGSKGRVNILIKNTKSDSNSKTG